MSLKVGESACTEVGVTRDSSWKPGLRTPMAIENDLTDISLTEPSLDRGMSSEAARG